ncbi:mediator of RNA polymerase II transcription subunit 15-like [Cheilinus undulatus]|uniref:mediator of RNA polymerase II transcription subunit 15-like n=1 Tax=Cheilinus undulatus TaxID=241271 RepID=UPI001BD548CC|nr:mediator of RNA polymerase II transcription subunit 15-like [Cheilinus undulatus]
MLSDTKRMKYTAMLHPHPSGKGDEPQQPVCQEEEVVLDQQVCNLERNSGPDQEPPQITEDQEEPCSRQEGEQLILKQETDTKNVPQQFLCKKEEFLADPHICYQERSSSLDQEGPKPPQLTEDQEEPCSCQEVEQPVLKQETGTCLNSDKDVPQQHVFKEEKAFADQRVCKQEKNSGPDQEEPEPPQLTEEKEEPCCRQEGEQFVLKQETGTCMNSDKGVCACFLDVPQHHLCKKEEALADKQVCKQEMNCSPDQEEQEPPQLAEDWGEPCSSQQLLLKQETDTFPLTSTNEGCDHGEPELQNEHQLLPHNSHDVVNQDPKVSKHRDSKTARNSVPKQGQNLL